MKDEQKFEGLKAQLVAENEKTHGKEARTRYGDAPLEAYARLARAKDKAAVNAASGYARRRLAQFRTALHTDSDNAARIKAAINQLQKAINRGEKKKRELDREKLAERGLAERTGSVAYESDRQLTHFLETWLRRPGGRTAVFAGNDIFALRTLSALRMLEVSVPRQAGVIGFDDTSTGRYLRPALSSVSQPIAAMAGEAVSRLLWRIDHPRAEEILDLALPAELVVRESA